MKATFVRTRAWPPAQENLGTSYPKEIESLRFLKKQWKWKGKGDQYLERKVSARCGCKGTEQRRIDMRSFYNEWVATPYILELSFCSEHDTLKDCGESY